MRNTSWTVAAAMMTMLGLVACDPVEDDCVRCIINDVDPSEMASGEEVIIRLESNATTGYLWEVISPDDEAVVELVSVEYNEPGSGLIGAGGSEDFTFRATGVGDAQIVLHYLQPWNPDELGDEFVQHVSVVE